LVGQGLERIKKDTDREFYMTANEAKQYGVVDQVLEVGTDLIKRKQRKQDGSRKS